MYSEIGFIFDSSMKMSNSNDTGTIYGRSLKIKKRSKPLNDPNTSGVNPTEVSPLSTGSKGNTTGTPIVNATLIYKDPKNRGNIPNYLKQSVYKNDNDQDPYIALLNHFGSLKPMRLNPADFAYLKDLGVYPINRLWVLRRYPDNCIVPNNLLAWGNNAVEPISTVVGWIKYKDESDFLSIRFNEVWTDQYDMLDKLFAEILKEEFKINQSVLVPVPGWSQGILFGILKQMGLTSDYDYNNIPTGDPNVLRQAKMRDIKSQGLLSSMNITLETTYEQKYINGIDPGMAMADIISNLFKMGTSDQRFILSNSPALQMLLTQTNNQVDVDTWLKLGQTLLTGFIDGVQRFINEVVNQSGNESTTITTNTETQPVNSATTTKTIDFAVKAPDQATLGAVGNVLRNIGAILLQGTVSKYRWPLKGSIGLMSGVNTTPWHLTIGNPMSPIINLGNIVVKNVELKLSNDLGFNDMPIFTTANIEVEMGRPLGRSELERMFNNGYSRLYANDNPAILSPSQVTSDGKTAADRNIESMTNINQTYNNLITGGLRK